MPPEAGANRQLVEDPATEASAKAAVGQFVKVMDTLEDSLAHIISLNRTVWFVPLTMKPNCIYFDPVEGTVVQDMSKSTVAPLQYPVCLQDMPNLAQSMRNLVNDPDEPRVHQPTAKLTRIEDELASTVMSYRKTAKRVTHNANFKEMRLLLTTMRSHIKDILNGMEVSTNSQYF
jgi:hypothetical protein